VQLKDEAFYVRYAFLLTGIPSVRLSVSLSLIRWYRALFTALSLLSDIFYLLV